MSNKTFKQITYGLMVAYTLFFVTFFIYDIALRPSSEVSVTPSGSGWVLLPIVDSLFISFAGLTFLILGFTNAIISWSRTADEYVELLSEMSIGGMGKRWLSIDLLHKSSGLK